MSTRSHPGERGTSLLEATFTITLLLMLMASVMQSYTSFAAATRRQEDAVAIRTTGRQAVVEVEALLRSVEVTHAATSSAEARQQLVVTRRRFGGTGTEVVRLRFDTGTGRLLRETLTGPTGSVTATRTLVTGVVAGTASFVRYFDVEGGELVPGVTDLSQIASCTATWRITIPISPGAGRTARELTTTVTTRNQRAEERSC